MIRLNDSAQAEPLTRARQDIARIVELVRGLNDPLQAASIFCESGDDGQAAFFHEMARIMNAWPSPAAALMQMRYLGDRMRLGVETYADARRLIIELAEILQENP